MGKPEQHKEAIMNLLRLHRQLDVRQVSDVLSVSDSTVRRLFARLEHDRAAIRTHGGIRLVPEMQRGYDMSESQSLRVPEKAAIGTAAAELVGSGELVFLDSGSTIAKLAEAILVRINAGTIRNLTVLTISLNVVDILSHATKVLAAGGEVRGQRRDVCGPVAEQMLSMFKVSHAFFGSDGIDLESGFMTTDERTASMNHGVLIRAAQSTVLADHTKFGRSSFISYAALNEVGTVLTDEGLDDRVTERFRRAGASVRRVALSVWPVGGNDRRGGPA